MCSEEGAFMRRLPIVGTVLSACFLFSTLAVAQTLTGTILGTVKDQSGAVLPGATVTATNTQTGIARNDTTGARGEYRISALGLGDYQVAVTMSGFQGETRNGITLTVGREAVVDFALAVGA